MFTTTKNDPVSKVLQRRRKRSPSKSVQAEAKLVAEPEKRGLDAAVDAEAEVPMAKEARTESVV